MKCRRFAPGEDCRALQLDPVDLVSKVHVPKTDSIEADSC